MIFSSSISALLAITGVRAKAPKLFVSNDLDLKPYPRARANKSPWVMQPISFLDVKIDFFQRLKNLRPSKMDHIFRGSSHQIAETAAIPLAQVQSGPGQT